MVCIDQQTGEKTVEPLRTISEQFAGKLRFGIYLSYVGTIGGSKDRFLKTSAMVKPVINDDDISRWKDLKMNILEQFQEASKTTFKVYIVLK